MGIAEWFSSFCGQLVIDNVKRQSLAYRTSRITRVLNTDFRNTDSEVANRFYVGSMGRNTAIPSVSDVDLLYVLPNSAYHQYNAYVGNKQSALLSAVRTTIRKTYPTSEVSGDGQVVVIAFNDGVIYEVLPAFLNDGGGFTFADTNNGGSWKTCKPKHEIDAFSSRDNSCNGNLVRLSRMARAWRDFNNVPMSGMLIDTLTYQFIESAPYKDKSFFYYDFMTRDFFRFLASQSTGQVHWLAPGSGSFVYRKGVFEYKAAMALRSAEDAIAYDQRGQTWSAKQKFREIYGPAFPS